MNRKELYDQIKKLGLQEQVKKKYGINFTQVSNYKLHNIIEAAKSVEVKPVENNKLIKATNSSPTCAFDRLIEVLGKKHILLKSEIDYIYN